MSSEEEVIRRSAGPLTAAEIVAALSALGVEPGAALIAHVSLSSLGWVSGGAQAVVESLLAALGPDGTLVMPSQSSQISDPANWSNPPAPVAWIPKIRDSLPAYDPAQTPARGMGVVIDCFLLHPETRRSPHPIYSFCARGPKAELIVGEHALTPAFGEKSPLGKLRALNAQLLLVGTGHRSNTSLHLAEHLALWPSKRFYRGGAPMLVDGQRQWVEYEDLLVETRDFERLGAAFERTGQVTTGRIGNAEALLMRQPDLVEFGASWFSRHRH